MGLVSVAQYPGAFGRTRTLHAAIYCTPLSGISAGQYGNGQVADRGRPSLRIRRLGLRVPPSAPGRRPLPIMKRPLLLPTPRTSSSGQLIHGVGRLLAQQAEPAQPAAAAHPSAGLRCAARQQDKSEGAGHAAVATVWLWPVQTPKPASPSPTNYSPMTSKTCSQQNRKGDFSGPASCSPRCYWHCSVRSSRLSPSRSISGQW